MAIVGSASVACIFFIVSGAVNERHVARQLANIQKRYLPKVELAPHLEHDLDRIHRLFQDAVAAEDYELLEETHALKDSFVERIKSARGAISPQDTQRLRVAFETYFGSAYDISRRLINGETGEVLLSQMAAMQKEHAGLTALLTRVAGFDKRQLAAAFSAVSEARLNASRARFAVGLACLVMLLLLSAWFSHGALRSIAALSAGFNRFARGELTEPIPLTTSDELGNVAILANKMAESLARLNAERDQTVWLKNGESGLAEKLRGELEPRELAQRGVQYIAQYLNAPAAALYYTDSERQLRLLGTFGTSDANIEPLPQASFRLADGLVGQAALSTDIVTISDLPSGYMKVRSGLGEASPRALLLVPLPHLGHHNGVLELAFFREPEERDYELLVRARDILTIGIEVAQGSAARRKLLDETQELAQRLSVQEEALKATNEELQSQQTVLQQTNEALTHKAKELNLQRETLEQKNAELSDARRSLEKKAEELATVSAYKSQFLANMSHELRTPLNSMLLLSNLLAENEAGNLTAKQVEYSKTVHSAGKDLLALINQVLDLAKIEAGKQDVRIEALPLRQVVDYAQRNFLPVAIKKGLKFNAELAPGLPKALFTDSHRLIQIVNNLLGNAIKFTERGEVTLQIKLPSSQVSFKRSDMTSGRVLEISVSDTGPGIPRNYQERIFAPFEQVEGGADRRHGGTGLGLTITRELVELLGGELQLDSVPGRGSVFSCYLPFEWSAHTSASVVESSITKSARIDFLDSTEALKQTARVLVLENDSSFAQTLTDLMRSSGLECEVAIDGKTALQMAQESSWDGVVLDLALHDMEGLDFLRALEQYAGVRKPSMIFNKHRALSKAETQHLKDYADSFIVKESASYERLIEEIRLFMRRFFCDLNVRQPVCLPPVDAHFTGVRILVVDDDMRNAYALSAMLRAKGAEVIVADTGLSAVDALTKSPDIDAVLMDIMMPEMDGYEAMRCIRENPRFRLLPIIALTAKAMKGDEQECLAAGATDYLTKPVDATLVVEVLLSHIKTNVSRTQQFTTFLNPARGQA